MTSFVPPQFKNFAKQQKDLFKKRYEFDNSLKVLNRAGSIQLEGGVVSTKSGDFRGFVKANGYKTPVLDGVLDVELHTDAGQESKASFKLVDKVAAGANVTLGVNSKDKSFSKTSASLELEYARARVSGLATVKSDGERHRLETSVTLGDNGLAAGGSAVVDLSNAPQLTETNFGFNFADKNYVVALYTENNRDVITGSYHVNVAPSKQVGAALRYDLAKDIRTFTIGSDVKLNDDSLGGAKLEVNNQAPDRINAALNWETRINPTFKFSVASQFKLAKDLKPEATGVGLGFTFGSF